MNNTLLEVTPGQVPKSVDGTALNNNSLHDWLALPIQHFMDRHPEKTRTELIHEVTEIVAELVASSTDNWRDAVRITKRTQRHLEDQVSRKWPIFVQLRINRD